jgi:hypothetical protein
VQNTTKPIITGPLTENTNEIKGKANKPIPGCTSEIKIHSTDAAKNETPLAPLDGSYSGVDSNGTFSVKLKTVLTTSQTITAIQVFVDTDVTPLAETNVSSDAMPVQAALASAPSPTPTPVPAIAGILREGASTVSGTIGKLPSNGNGAATACTAQVEVHDVSIGDQLMLLNGGTARADVTAAGTFSVTLQEPLRNGQKIQVNEIPQNCTGMPDHLSSLVAPVVIPGDWGLVKGYFVSGILISQDQNSFSQSSLYMEFNLDKTWRLPGYYHQTAQKPATPKTKKIKNPAPQTSSPSVKQSRATSQGDPSRGPAANLIVEEAEDGSSSAMATASAQNPVGAATPTPTPMRSGRAPGINTYFDVRLTSIPVSSCVPAASNANASGSSGQQTACSTSPAATPSPTPLDVFLSSQKTARVAVGIYFPWTITNWNYNKTPNALFLAPIAKVGFDTPAGSLNQNQPASTTVSGTGVSNSGVVTAVNPTNFYNFYAWGTRIGHYALTPPTDRDSAPDLISYLDVAFGRFSNLETLVQPQGNGVGPTVRQRLIRIQLEGMLKVPSTPLFIGINANVGQESASVGKGSIVQRAGDDLRFLFGVKFDVAKLLSHVTQVAP